MKNLSHIEMEKSVEKKKIEINEDIKKYKKRENKNVLRKEGGDKFVKRRNINNSNNNERVNKNKNNKNSIRI
ncbi:hypothetical protein NUSPORA_01830 [Nucleospora cyclopteri]